MVRVLEEVQRGSDDGDGDRHNAVVSYGKENFFPVYLLFHISELSEKASVVLVE